MEFEVALKEAGIKNYKIESYILVVEIEGKEDGQALAAAAEKYGHKVDFYKYYPDHDLTRFYILLRSFS